MAYIASRWVSTSRTETDSNQRAPIRAITLSECAALVLHCFLRAMCEGMPLFTHCPDSRLDARRHHPCQGVLFRLQPSLVALIRSVGIVALFEGSLFSDDYTYSLLELVLRRPWRDDADFICVVQLGTTTPTGRCEPDGGAGATVATGRTRAPAEYNSTSRVTRGTPAGRDRSHGHTYVIRTVVS